MGSEAQGARGEDWYSSYYTVLSLVEVKVSTWEEKNQYTDLVTDQPLDPLNEIQCLYPETTRPPICICLDVKSDTSTHCIHIHRVCSQLYQCWPLRWQWVLSGSKWCPAQAQTTTGIRQHDQAVSHHNPWCLSSTSGMLALVGLLLFKHAADWVLWTASTESHIPTVVIMTSFTSSTFSLSHWSVCPWSPSDAPPRCSPLLKRTLLVGTVVCIARLLHLANMLKHRMTNIVVKIKHS
jgi:hypothetical protein